MWTGTEIVWCIGMYSGGESLLLNAACAAGTGGIFAILYWRGTNNVWTLREKLCASMGLTALFAGCISGYPLVTILGCILAYSFAVIHYVLEAWKDPGREPLSAWSLWLLGSIAFLYVQWGDWSLESISTPLAVVAEEAIMVVVLVYARTRRGRVALAAHSL